jgi:hypothetical protein
MNAHIHLPFIFLLLWLTTAGAQDKYDYIWISGYRSNSGNPASLQGGILFDFHTPPLSASYFNIPIFLNAYTHICDKDGQVLYYTNGCKIINRNHEVMYNGEEINVGTRAYNSCAEHDYRLMQGLLALPAFAEHPDDYFLFHLRKHDTLPLYHIGYDLLLTTINASEQEGLGAVTEKNQFIHQGFFLEHLSAVRHANGRDWWIVLPHWVSNEFYVWRFAPDGLHGPIVQEIGRGWTGVNWGGQVAFSPDGTKYAMANFYNGLQLLDFDRCSGAFSNPVYMLREDLPLNDFGPTGVGFSPSSRFLYLSWSTKLFQFDLAAPGIPPSRVEIASARHYSFFQQQLAPDGKIYMSSSIAMNFLHVIHEPNKRGKACAFEEIGLTLPARRGWMMPNQPNYRLYELPGSPCDTLGIRLNPPIPGAAVKVYPNPASHALQVVIPQLWSGQALQFRLYDAIGRPLRHIRWDGFPFDITIDVSELPAAMYFWEVRSEAERLGQGKVVVAR